MDNSQYYDIITEFLDQGYNSWQIAFFLRINPFDLTNFLIYVFDLEDYKNESIGID